MTNRTDGLVGAVPPPPGRVPNFENPQDLGRVPHLIGVITCFALSTLFVAIRCYVKVTNTNRRWMIEDMTCLASWTFLVAYSTTILKMISHGEDHHAWEVTVDNYSQFLKWLYISTLLYNPTVYLTKTTLLLLTARAFAVYERVALGLRVFIFAVLIAYIPIQIVKTVVCRPIRAYWDTSIKNAHCLGQRQAFIYDISVALFTDALILIVPIPLTWSLSMPLIKKVKIAVILGAGGVAMGVLIFRAYKCVLFLDSNDVTADFGILDLTCCMEISIGLICASLPSINMLMERTWPAKASAQANCPRTPLMRRMNYLDTLQGQLTSSKPITLTNCLMSQNHMNIDLESRMCAGQQRQLGDNDSLPPGQQEDKNPGNQQIDRGP
ncbi:uncharacterized protein BCR38DRAFT_512850 [Pseudomassariella vexata]|uniref:Rhodopsin domain-containing protein n=1 Tax=Pseudomassariella vexata TaxID=1141098 RepID=A0A1Y2E4W3_9PEZI|nr:uncharacterized protein BCR38DRAFT_512850 [Pseudomassariella vexata]ORY66613.1 hypothetical protein BCR38DRAFT_512850 [Pseudomassariella vexata]